MLETPAATAALLTSGGLPSEVVFALRAGDWVAAGLAADRALTRPELDPATRGPLALTGAYCFARAERADASVFRARLLLDEAVARGVSADTGLAAAVAQEPPLSKSWAITAEWARSADRKKVRGAVHTYLEFLVDKGDDPDWGALPYAAIQGVGDAALVVHDNDGLLALPLLREVVAVVPAQVLPFSLQTLVRDLWIALIDATSEHVSGREAAAVQAAARKWLPEYLLTGPKAFHFDEPVRVRSLPHASRDDTAGPVPYAVAALVESGRLPEVLDADPTDDWGDLAEHIDAALAAPDLDPDVRGPLTLAGAYAYVCFGSLMSGDSYLRARRAMTLLGAVPEGVDDDAPGHEPSLYRNIKWQVEGEHRKEEWPELLERADSQLDANDGERSLAVALYTMALRAHADEPAPEGLPYGTLEHIAEKADELSYGDKELARPLLRAVATAVPAAMLPYTVQLAIRDVWRRLDDSDAARAWLPAHLTA